MSTSLKIRDEEVTGKIVHEFSLDFITECITVRELIRSRVYQEVMDYNTKQNSTEFQGLVRPKEAERTLTGYRLREIRRIDWKAQFAKAVEAFEESQILIIVNRRQVESLDERIEVSADTTVSFLRLTLLVGG